MSAKLDNVRMRLVSIPYRERRGLIPFAIALSVFWLLLCVWLAVACIVLFKSLPWGILLLGTVAAFAICLGSFTRGALKDAFRDYVFEISDTEAVLTVEDRLKRRRSTQMVLLNDISYAEYYPYTDSACLIFHAPYIQMEVPLSPMGNRGQDVLDFLNGRGVRVVNVQTDDKIPD
jgi:hypothetical protein